MSLTRHSLALAATFSLVAPPLAAQAPALSAAVTQYVTVNAPVVAIIHVRVIDGTGATPREAQTVVVADGKIRAIGADGAVSVPAGAKVIDATGKSLLPGLVMVHEHMFYPSAGGLPSYIEQPFSFPRLYLGGGVTTARTAGSMEPYTDINLRRVIDAGRMAGPKLDVTGPYLTGPGLGLLQFHELRDSADARRTVAMWADLGATSFKAYMNITRDELRAAVSEAHKRGLKITGHLCSVTLREAADIGIDDIEHGLVASTDFVPGKQPDQCNAAAETPALLALDVASDTVKALIRHLVAHHVAVTSTLAVFETFAPRQPLASRRVLDAMSADARTQYLRNRAARSVAATSPWTELLAKEMAFEKEFLAAGGLLLAGADPTGFGGALPGYADQRDLELLVDGGLTPLQAITVATLNGATYLGRADRVGSIAVGKDADLLLVAGDPSSRIADIEQLEIVFKDGVGYDSAKLLESARGMVGLQ